MHEVVTDHLLPDPLFQRSGLSCAFEDRGQWNNGLELNEDEEHHTSRGATAIVQLQPTTLYPHVNATSYGTARMGDFLPCH